MIIIPKYCQDFDLVLQEHTVATCKPLHYTNVLHITDVHVVLFKIEKHRYQYVAPLLDGLTREEVILAIGFSFSKQYSHKWDAGEVLEHIPPSNGHCALVTPRRQRIVNLASAKYCHEHVERTNLDLGGVILIAPGDKVTIQFGTVDAECGQTIGDLARLLVDLAARE